MEGWKTEVNEEPWTYMAFFSGGGQQTTEEA